MLVAKLLMGPQANQLNKVNKMHNIISSKMFPWRMAQARIAWVSYVTLPMRINEQFNKIWVSVMYPEPKK